MWGISYGGFTSIQVAKLRPPHLRAIVPIMATDDRYRDDVHYRGGCLTVSEQSQYAVSQVAMNAMPPDAVVPWDAVARRVAGPPRGDAAVALEWLRQQTDGPYWRQGSLAPTTTRIEVPILAHGGWHDSYVDPAFRMQERCTAPPTPLVRPWGHGLPDSAEPGPTLGWLPEMLAFFDRHLRGVDGPAEPSPAVGWFQREWSPPAAFPAALAGEWLGAEAYPDPGHARPSRGGSPAVRRRWSAASRGGAGDAATAGADAGAPSADARHGRAASRGAPAAPRTASPATSDPTRRSSLTYTSEPLTGPLDALGFPEVVLHLTAERRSRRSSSGYRRRPDGTSAQVSAGILNLTHRRVATSEPEPLVPGASRRSASRCGRWATAGSPGHRIRVSVATQSWPIIWPSPAARDAHRPPRIRRARRAWSCRSSPPRPNVPIRPAPPTAPPHRPDLRDVGSGDDDPPVWRIDEDVVAGSVTVHVYEGGTPSSRTAARCSARSAST